MCPFPTQTMVVCLLPHLPLMDEDWCPLQDENSGDFLGQGVQSVARPLLGSHEWKAENNRGSVVKLNILLVFFDPFCGDRSIPLF